MRVSLIPFLLTALLLCTPLPLFAETMYLFGKIGELPIAATIEQKDGKLAGWYFYHSQGRQIRMEGTITADGFFRINETVSGKSTGLFEGRAQQGTWTGTWRKASGGASLKFSLEENRHHIAKTSGTYECMANEHLPAVRRSFEWILRLTLADGVVKQLSAVQSSTGSDQDEQACSIGLNDLKQVSSKTGIMMIARDDAAEDETTCSIRILGTSDLLWIRFGDSSREGNDCRSCGDTMFCSTRAFWNDLILDRRTQKCRVVK